VGGRTQLVFRTVWFALAATAFAVTPAVALGGCRADLPTVIDAGEDVVDDCTPYADLLVTYTDATGAPAMGGAALGPPDDTSISIAVNAALEVGFVGLGAVLDDGEAFGPDIRVHATASAGTEVEVSLSTDGAAWETAGTITDEMLDIEIANTASLSQATFVQLVGVAGQLSVDALQSLQTGCDTSVR
jgi:hypothetical protein